MIATLHGSGPPLTTEDLDMVERHLGRRLPAPYRTFLLAHNGGRLWSDAFEVVSPTDHAGKVMEKVRDCLDGGARRVWLLYPEQRSVTVYHADGSSRVVRGDEAILADDELLPGFGVSLNLVFA